jgi:hypothetical protein
MQPRHSACQGAKWPITQAVTDPFHAHSLGVQGLGSGETGRGSLERAPRRCAAVVSGPV